MRTKKRKKFRKIVREKFERLREKRYKSYIKHKLVDVLICVMVGVLCGLDKTEEIALYCQKKSKRLKKIFKVETIASESTINRV